MTLDDLLAKHPGPWTYSPRYKAAIDAKGVHACSGCDERLVEAVNRIGDLQAERDSLANAHEVMRNIVESVQAELVKSVQVQRERDSLQSKVEELEAIVRETERAKSNPGVCWICNNDSVNEQRRFEAACAFGASHYARGMFSADPDAIATFAVKYADALLAELAKTKEDTSNGMGG